MVERNLLIMFALIFMIFIITSMAFASAHQMNHNMQGRNSNSISMQRANNYMHMNQQNNFMHNSIGNSRMSLQQDAYINIPNHRHINNHMHRY